VLRVEHVDTVAPSPDTADERLHLTPANLSRHLHRAMEAPETTAILRRIFADEAHFWVHEPLAGGDPMRDEGAANHTRLTPDFAEPGLHLFVYGVAEEFPEKPRPKKYTARQTLAASQAIARRHQLRPEQTLFIQQNPTAIDAGVFHHDVIGVGHRDILFCHEDAFAEPAAYAQIAAAYQQLTATELRVVTVPRDEVSVSTAVATYLFNSQIVTTQTGKTVLIAPGECGEDPAVKAYLERAVADAGHPLDAVEIFDLRESMHNGGGPACLRQRIVLSTTQAAALQGRVILDDALADELESWVTRHYREELRPADLADPQLLEECQTALDQLTQILALPSLYAFQS